ncbi:MAG: membrane lipoprotein lipid attachment site-containing protein [Clostridiaceae bacterium]|nr:membrane lipoprotein lipid attachment site-containing protein [Clostridiaceae bacterium]
MKKIFFLLFIISTLTVSGCNNKSNITTTKNDNISSTNNTKTSNQPQNASIEITTPSATEKSQENQPNIKLLKPTTIPQLTSAQKAQVNNKLDSVISSINSSLNSLDSINDVDISSVN